MKAKIAFLIDCLGDEYLKKAHPLITKPKATTQKVMFCKSCCSKFRGNP
jgi:hypothetical protein